MIVICKIIENIFSFDKNQCNRNSNTQGPKRENKIVAHITTGDGMRTVSGQSTVRGKKII